MTELQDKEVKTHGEGSVLAMNALAIQEITNLPATQVYLHPGYADILAEIESVVRSTVHEPDENGLAESKKFASSIRGSLSTAKTLRIEGKKSIDANKLLWEKAAIAAENGVEAALKDNARQFEVLIDKRLDEIRDALLDALIARLDTDGVEGAFRKNLSVSHLVRLNGSITPTGALTKRSINGIGDIVISCLQNQTRFKLRQQTFKAMCLESEINPPLDIEVIGSMVDAEESAFLAQCQESISLELNRKELAEQKMREKLENEKQAAIEAALKAEQEELNRKAIEAARAEREEVEKLNQAVVKEVLTACADASESSPAPAPAGKQTVGFYLKFLIEIDAKYSSDEITGFIETHIARKVLSALNTKNVKAEFRGARINESI